MNVLITGAGGQLGRELTSVFGERAITAAPAQLDVTDAAAVRAMLHEYTPTVVINAAAFTDVDGCERAPEQAHEVNAVGPANLARACADIDARLVQISTDYVFGADPPPDENEQPRGYRPEDPPAPINVYGTSKLAGEQAVASAAANSLIVRTAWLAGSGRNFVTTMRARGRERQRLYVVADQVGTPTTTKDLAAAIVRLVDQRASGLHHVVNAGHASRFELAAEVLELSGIDVELHAQSSVQAGSRAPRPAWSVLEPSVPMRSWRQALAELIDDLDAAVAASD